MIRFLLVGSVLVSFCVACAATDGGVGAAEQDQVGDAGVAFAPVHIHDYTRSDWATRYVYDVPAGRYTVSVSNMKRYPRPSPPTAYGLEVNKDPQPAGSPAVFAGGDWVCHEIYTDYRDVHCVVTFDSPGRLGVQIEGWTTTFPFGNMDFDLDVTAQ